MNVHGTGVCTCNSGYYGVACADECPGGALSPCSDHGICDDGSTGTGMCTCEANVFGSFCQSICPFTSVGVCDTHGYCFDGSNGNGTCHCQKSYFGNSCQYQCPGGITSPCSLHGICSDGSSGAGTCSCDKGYFNSDCSRECPGGAATACSLHGICADGALGNGVCTCQKGYYGTSCAKECPGGASDPCNGNGKCIDGATGTGKCECYAGFFGDDCSKFGSLPTGMTAGAGSTAVATGAASASAGGGSGGGFIKLVTVLENIIRMSHISLDYPEWYLQFVSEVGFVSFAISPPSFLTIEEQEYDMESDTNIEIYAKMTTDTYIDWFKVTVFWLGVVFVIVVIFDGIWFISCWFGSKAFKLVMKKEDPNNMLKILGQEEFKMTQKVILKLTYFLSTLFFAVFFAAIYPTTMTAMVQMSQGTESSFFVAGILCFLILASGISPAMYLLLHWLRNDLEHPRTVSLCGILFDLYKKEYIFMMPVEMLRLYLDAIAIFVFIGYPALQLSFVTSFALVQVVWHVKKNVYRDDEKFERKLQIFNLLCDFAELLLCWFHYFLPSEENVLILSYIQMGSIMVNIVLSLIQLVKDFKYRLKTMFQRIQLLRTRSRSARSWRKLRAASRILNPLSRASSSAKGNSHGSLPSLIESEDVDDDAEQKPLAPIGPLSVSRPIQLVPISRTANAFHDGADGPTGAPLGPPPLNPLSFISASSFRSKPADTATVQGGVGGGGSIGGLTPKLQFSAAVKNVIADLRKKQRLPPIAGSKK
eukprot:TRINITY_DN604_c0_g1_i9.p1 TRINITY_DN604_c0_g1~~TRINITY_DN604_c0_g1_i9.p1  ORF type:complete len:762 (-),score=120.00 TRINITY_DN604_c0_g1_i9:162-2447(-)